MRVVSVVGARPQFVKLAPVAEALKAVGVDHRIVHTGQHYDSAMSDVFFSDLVIPSPDVQLAIGSGSHGQQTGAMLARLEPALLAAEPDWVLVYGDTNTTLAGALAAVKTHLPVAHLEAGLRSFNRRMPEEHNRVLTDHAADLLLAPTQTAIGHLADEGLATRSVLVGDVMTDVCLRIRDQALERPAKPIAGMSPGEYVVATIHRAENTDDPGRLREVIDSLAEVPVPVLLLVHPRLRARCEEFGIDLQRGVLRPAAPLPYPDLISAVLGSRGVVTDSGGLQKEAYVLGRVCTTVRTETEWPETLESGWNVVLPDLRALREWAIRAAPDSAPLPAFGDGSAGHRVAQVLVNAR